MQTRNYISKRIDLYKSPFTYNNSGIVLEYNGTMFVKEQVKMPTRSFNNSEKNTTNNSVQIDFLIGHRILVKPVYKIVEIRKSSNAYISGLRKGDILISINGKPSYNQELSKINEILYGKTGKTPSVKNRTQRCTYVV